MNIQTVAVVYKVERKLVDDKIKLVCEDIKTFDTGTTVERCHAAMTKRDELNDKYETVDRWYGCETR